MLLPIIIIITIIIIIITAKHIIPVFSTS